MATGLDLRRDVLSWMGDAGLFATRDGGALVVEAKDRAAMRAAVGKLRPLVGLLGGGQARPLRSQGVDEGFVIDGGGAGGPVYVAAAGERFVVAKGRRALRLAVDGGDRLGDRDDVRAAAAQLGDDIRPSLFADLPALVDLLGGHGRGAKGGGEARELLEAFGALVGGSRRDGDVTRTRLVATLPG
jgi:hypothetical protein